MNAGTESSGGASPVLARTLLSLRLAAGEDADVEAVGWSMGAMVGRRAVMRIRRQTGWPAPGDVILVDDGSDLVAHRVLKCDRRHGRLVTKGDACRHADEPMMPPTVVGRVVGLVENGRLHTPFRMRRPWARWLALNSSAQAWFWRTFPRVPASLDLFSWIHRIIERLEKGRT